MGSTDQFCIPTALAPYAKLPCWVVWRMETVNGKPTKVPYQPEHPTWKAKSDKPSTWGDLDTALEVAESDCFDGIGLELANGEIGAFDIDHCRDQDTGDIHHKVMELVERTNSYTEVTPSGTGLRIIGIYCGQLEAGIKRPLPGANGVSIEVYPASERYITVTGDHLEGTPETLSDITDVMDNVVEELANEKSNSKTAADEPPINDDQELPASLTTRLYIPDGGAGKQHAGYNSRSELAYAFISDALRARITAKKIVSSCVDPAHDGHAIYEHCNDNGGKAYVERQVAQAKAKIKSDLDAQIEELNEDHALVLVGDKSAVMKFDIKGRTQFKLLQVGAFKQWFANRHITVGKKVMTIAEYWLAHSKRRQYKDIENRARATARSCWPTSWTTWPEAMSNTTIGS
jgi:hypothetical protein